MSESRDQQLPNYCVTDDVPSKLVEKLVKLGNATREVYSGDENQRLHDILVLYLLRLLALVSCTSSAIEGAIPEAVVEVANLSCSDLYVKEFLTTRKLEEILDRYTDEDEDEILRTEFEARIGAPLAEQCTGGFTIKLFQRNIGIRSSEKSNREWTSGCFLCHQHGKHFVPLGWNQDVSFQQKGVTLITSLLEVLRTMSSTSHPVQPDDASVQIMRALKRIQDLVVYTANPMLRREAYGLLIKLTLSLLANEGLFSDCQRFFQHQKERFQALYDMITNCDHPSLVSLLLNCVKDEVVSAWPPIVETPIQTQAFGHSTSASAETLVQGTILSPFASSQVLKYIQCVLRTRDGSLLELPRNVDAVLSSDQGIFRKYQLHPRAWL